MNENHNPAGTDGFEFLEFSTPNLQQLTEQFISMGFVPVAKHKTAQATLFQQNNIRFIINTTPNSMASQFAKLHGPSTCAMGFRVKDARAAHALALSKGAKNFEPQSGLNLYNTPAIYGVGDSLIYFIDHPSAKPEYLNHFDEIPHAASSGVGLMYLDHVTHNLHRGQMNKWAEFYEKIFNFREIRYFDIEGKLTGLKSRAMTSPCGKIRIPLNESSDDKSQIEEFLHLYNGEGIQHIALGTSTIFESVEQLKSNGLKFLDTPDTYYDLLDKRLPNHGESVPSLRKNRILLDGNTSQDQRRLLLQIFTQNMLGPVFFEIIQRKGDEGFGEGNFKALFESIELDQIQRGVLKEPV